MSTKSYILTQTPVQITDGSKAAYVQETQGAFTRLAASPTQPNTASTPYATILRNDISIAQGFRVWAWNGGTEPLEIVVLTSEV